MELRHLRYFLAVAAEENVSRAALKLHVSQPAVSRQIRDLEDELGFALFQREPQAVRLTEAGRSFRSGAERVLEAVDGAVKRAKSIAEEGAGELHIGYAPTVTARFLPPALRAFQAAHPRVRVKLHDLSSEEMLAGVHEGRLQLALVVRVTGGLLRGVSYLELRKEPLCVAAAPKHPLARHKTVSLAQVLEQPLVAYSRAEYPEYHELLARVLGGRRHKPRIVAEHDSVSSLVAEVEAGRGIALVPDSLRCTTGPRLKLLPFSPPVAPLSVGAVWLKGKLPPLTEAFLESARAAAAEVAAELT